MHILVVSGFLGAGKTTFIQELARRTSRDFVIYENEYGQADIDAKLLAQNDELSVWESTENCICCSGKQDFATSILTISNTLDPEYLVVEPTGVAKLSNILDNINKVRYERVSLLAPLVLIDATQWEHQRGEYADIYLDQIKTAPTVVLTKTEHAMAEVIPEILSWVRELNPDAAIVDRPYSQMDNSWFESFLTNEYVLESIDDFGDSNTSDDADKTSGSKSFRGVVIPRRSLEDEEDNLETLSLNNIELPSESHLIWFLDALVAGVFGHIVRAKGTIVFKSQTIKFDVVGGAWSITGLDADDATVVDSRGVFIGSDIKRGWLREVLVSLINQASNKSSQHTYRIAGSEYAKSFSKN